MSTISEKATPLASQRAAMKDNPIGRWLRLPEGVWPPDHYTLLGLPPGTSDPHLIEARVHDRMARLRGYQLSHPAQATEAMNRLAEAFACLTNPQSKSRYDQSLGIENVGEASTPDRPGAGASPPPTGGQDTQGQGHSTIVLWTGASLPPVRRGGGDQANIETVELPAVSPPAAWEDSGSPEGLQGTQGQASSAAVLTAEPADPILEQARTSPVARRGLATRRQLYERIRLTRRLLTAWRRVGKFCGAAERNLTTEKERLYLQYWLNRVDTLVYDFPPVLGRTARPGYRVAILARDEDPVREFTRMEPAVREQLRLDWKLGATCLEAHLEFLRAEARRRRGSSRLADAWRVVAGFVQEHRLATAFGGIVLLALCLFLALLLFTP